MTGGDRPRAFIEMELLNGSNGRQLLLLKERLEVPHALDVLIDICTRSTPRTGPESFIRISSRTISSFTSTNGAARP